MGLFMPEIGLVIWMFISFALLFLILWRFAWPFIIDTLEKRADVIDKGVVYAQNAKEQLDNARVDAQNIIADAQKRQAEILRDADRMKVSMIEEAKAAASAEAKKVMESAQQSIEQARKESEAQLRKEVSAFALEIAEKVVRQNLSDDKAQTELVEKLLSEVGTKN